MTLPELTLFMEQETMAHHCKKAFVILQLLTRNSPLWQPAMSIQQTLSTGTA